MARSLLAIIGIIMLAMSAAHAQSEWRVQNEIDAMTDERKVRVCNRDSFLAEICFYEIDGNEGGLFISYEMPKESPAMFDMKRIPLLRVDSNPVEDMNELMQLETMLKTKVIPRTMNPRWLSWRAQAREWKEGREGIMGQLTKGSTLRVRHFQTGGYQKDSTVSLTGFKDVATKAGLLRP